MASATPLLTDFPVVSGLPEKDIKDVLTDERLTNAILFTVPAVTAAMDEQEKLSRENEELAKKNLALQEELLALRSSTASAYATAQHMKDRWAELENQQAQLYQRYRPSFLHMRLRHSVNDQDSKTEALASSFIDNTDNDQTVDAFIKSFRAERTTYHKQAYWCEKWTKGEVAWRED